jgi:2-hydroxychromene-2-carboxylate isomerase
VTEQIRFYFDPTCPWAWQTAKWIREVEQVRDIQVDWRLFSLRLVNEGADDPLTDTSARSVPALRTLALVGREQGNGAIPRLYQAIGERIHDKDGDLSVDLLREALTASDLDPGVVDRAMADPSTAEDVRAQYREAVDTVQGFGVPTIVLDSGRGIFGPVVSVAPTGEEAGQVWDHTRWLIEFDGFFDLKRERDRKAGQAAAVA